MAMEYIKDDPYSALTRLKGPPSLVVVPQLVEEVDFMHARNYVSRDIKPANVLIQWNDDQPVLKVADVGSMKQVDDGLKTFAGTPVYMAPECWSANPWYSKEVDMWALGLVLLQLFTEWEPRDDRAWVEGGPYGKHNKLGFSIWISEVLMPYIETAVPGSVQQVLKGVLCESPQDRWSAARCQTWVEDEFLPDVRKPADKPNLKRRRDIDLRDLEDDEFKTRSSYPTIPADFTGSNTKS